MTEKDKGLLRPLSGRDPMGILPIWQHRARDVVPHLTAASRHLDGFHVLLSALAWWPEFSKKYNQPTKKLTVYFLLVEQAFARACTLKQTQWNLPGRRRLLIGNPVFIGLKPEHHLLGGQLQNGVWGLYRGPAESAYLIDKQNAVNRNIIEKIKSKSKVVELLFPYIIKEFKQQSEDGVKIAVRGNHKLVCELSKIIESYPFAKLIDKPFLSPTEPDTTSTVVSLMRQQIKHDTFTPQSFILQAKVKIPEHAKTFQHLINCEHYIAIIESVFDWLCTGLSSSVEEAAEKLKINMDDLKSASEEFERSGEYPDKSLVSKRIKMLRNLKLDNKQTLIETILDMHKTVSESRNNMPWITIQENGRFDIVVSRGLPTEDQLNPGTSWRNSYYLDSLFNLTSQFYKVGIRK